MTLLWSFSSSNKSSSYSKPNQNEKKQTDMPSIARVLTIGGFVLLLLFSNNVHFSIPIANGQEQREETATTPSSANSTKCNTPPAPGVDLSGCNLSFANLTNANLRNAKLRDATLVDVDLRNADLREADISGFFVLLGADLRNADLTNADLFGADLFRESIRIIYLDTIP